MEKMMITPNDVIETGNMIFMCSASDVEAFRKGFPKTVKTCLGNGMAFVGHSKKIVDGDLLYVRYRQAAGCIDLIVYND